MKICPYCAESIQDEAIKCRYCGEFLDGRVRATPVVTTTLPAGFLGFEYKSEWSIAGLPLLHIALANDPQTGRPRVAKGVIAIGNIAIGVLALGGVAMGGIAFGGLAVGVLALGGLAVGGFAFGGAAIGVTLAVGGFALSAKYAIGGAAIAPHALGGTGADPEALKLLEKWFPDAAKMFQADQL